MATEMSDRTLRALGILVAASQAEMNGQRGVSLVGVEEPEMALHPGAAEVIAEVLCLASERVQVVATTHSPDLLNHKAIRDEQLLAVSADNGGTMIGPLEPGARSALRDRPRLHRRRPGRCRERPDHRSADRCRQASARATQAVSWRERLTQSV